MNDVAWFQFTLINHLYTCHFGEGVTGDFFCYLIWSGIMSVCPALVECTKYLWSDINIKGKQSLDGGFPPFSIGRLSQWWWRVRFQRCVAASSLWCVTSFIWLCWGARILITKPSGGHFEGGLLNTGDCSGPLIQRLEDICLIVIILSVLLDELTIYLEPLY